MPSLHSHCTRSQLSRAQLEIYLIRMPRPARHGRAGPGNYLIITRGFYGTTALVSQSPVPLYLRVLYSYLYIVPRRQEVLLVVTNTFEGPTFVLPRLTTSSASISACTQASFPLPDVAQVDQVAGMYSVSAPKEMLPTAED